MIPDLNIFGTVSRKLTLTGRSYTVDDDPGEQFMVSLQIPPTSKTNDGSPRDNSPYILRWRSGLLGPSEAPQAGWRVALTRPPETRVYENLTYELIGDPREIRRGPQSAGIQAEAMPVGDLYPYTGSLKEQDGTEVEEVIFALWSEREDHATTGTYEEFSGEAPVEFESLIKANRRIVVGTDTYRIVSSVMDLEGPRVKFSARRSNA